MKASLRIEAVGDYMNERQRETVRTIVTDSNGFGTLQDNAKKRYWCAEIIGFNEKFGYDRKFVRAKKDYADSNSIGSRGVFVYYTLDSGKVYEVLHPYNWKKSSRYFCIVSDDGEIVKISEEELKEWLQLQAMLARASETLQSAG